MLKRNLKKGAQAMRQTGFAGALRLLLLAIGFVLFMYGFTLSARDMGSPAAIGTQRLLPGLARSPLAGLLPPGRLAVAQSAPLISTSLQTRPSGPVAVPRSAPAAIGTPARAAKPAVPRDSAAVARYLRPVAARAAQAVPQQVESALPQKPDRAW